MNEHSAENGDRAVKFRVCPRCGRDNGVKLLLDQPCEPRDIPPGETS